MSKIGYDSNLRSLGGICRYRLYFYLQQGLGMDFEKRVKNGTLLDLLLSLVMYVDRCRYIILYDTRNISRERYILRPSDSTSLGIIYLWSLRLDTHQYTKDSKIRSNQRTGSWGHLCIRDDTTGHYFPPKISNHGPQPTHL